VSLAVLDQENVLALSLAREICLALADGDSFKALPMAFSMDFNFRGLKVIASS